MAGVILDLNHIESLWDVLVRDLCKHSLILAFLTYLQTALKEGMATAYSVVVDHLMKSMIT